MKRICFLAVLMALGSSAHAGNSYSFVVGGHRIRIEASSHCNSPSCVSVSIPGIYEKRRAHDRYDDAAATPAAAPTKPPAPATEQVQPPASPASKSSTEHAVAAPPPAIVAAPAPPQDAAPLPQSIEPPKTPIVTPPASAPIEPPPAAMQPVPEAAPQVLKISHDEEPAVTPLGDWRIEGKKQSVRIAQCGQALCGYILNPSSNERGETVLINMKPSDAKWTGNIYSRDSGATYYGTIALKGPNSLRVEACALGKFFCSGTVWSRIDAKSEKLISSGQPSPELRS
jgi:Uncharacterized protein conserved in bacteria (DUF2147)